MEERVLAKKSDIIAIAESIRSKTGDTNKIALEEMPELIENIGDGVSPIYQTIAENLVMDKTLITDEHLEIFKDITKLSSHAFAYCSSITTANFSEVTTVPTYAFSYCSNLTTANFMKTTSLGNQAFYSSGKLVNINFPLLQQCSTQSFSYCDSLVTATFPSLTKLNGTTAFGYNKALSSLFFDANSAGSIGDYSFRDCPVLTILVIRSEQVWTLFNINAFTNTPIASGTGYIYVPSSTIETYKTAANWSTYANQFRALEDYTVDGTITGALDETKIAAINEV